MTKDCLELDALIDAARTGAQLPPEILRHLDGCPECRADYATLQALAEALRESAALPAPWVGPFIAGLPAAAAAERRRKRERLGAPFVTGALAAATAGLAALALRPAGPAYQPSLHTAAPLIAIVAITAATLELRTFRTTPAS